MWPLTIRKWERERESGERARESAMESAMVRREKIARRLATEGRSAASQWSPRRSRLLWTIGKENPKFSSWRRREGFRYGSVWDWKA
ncbi:hypothetical protein CK203_090633 [Vitis vinifera]|uniref:Uncharacterized protein n=1 Tax=Vitis vinifera TaxID=29760 RepID=A0A438DVY7_VITVI|nr:hypothetical protein CK203_090633 [Vitis vinifera]